MFPELYGSPPPFGLLSACRRYRCLRSDATWDDVELARAWSGWIDVRGGELVRNTAVRDESAEALSDSDADGEVRAARSAAGGSASCVDPSNAIRHGKVARFLLSTVPIEEICICQNAARILRMFHLVVLATHSI